MKNALILLHGFKRNGVDDFKEVLEEIHYDNLEIHNIVWFENYDKSTLKMKYLNKKLDDIVDHFNDPKNKYGRVSIVGYSIGAIVASMLIERLEIKIENVFMIAPPIKIHLFRWVKFIFSNPLKKIKIKKRMGKEKYEKFKERVKNNQIVEKYPITISLFINKIRMKNRKFLKTLLDDNFLFIFSPTDHIVHSSKSIKYLKKIGITKNIELINFNHEYVMTTERKEIIKKIEEYYE